MTEIVSVEKMSKRKSITGVKNIDMSFEDDDAFENDSGTSYSDSQKQSQASSISRHSGRAKKVKAIYDPSEHNGPVHKRKKEALENEKLNEKIKAESKVLPPKDSPKDPPKPITPTKAEAKKPAPDKPKVKRSSSAEYEPKPKTPTGAIAKPEADVTKKIRKPVKVEIAKGKIVVVTKKASPVPAPAVTSPTVTSIVPSAKEPSKRIQARKQTVSDGHTAFTEFLMKRHQLNSEDSEDYDNASTVELNASTVVSGVIPDVRKWSHDKVYEYFSTKLGFSRSDSVVFKDEVKRLINETTKSI